MTCDLKWENITSKPMRSINAALKFYSKFSNFTHISSLLNLKPFRTVTNCAHFEIPSSPSSSAINITSKIHKSNFDELCASYFIFICLG